MHSTRQNEAKLGIKWQKVFRWVWLFVTASWFMRPWLQAFESRSLFNIHEYSEIWNRCILLWKASFNMTFHRQNILRSERYFLPHTRLFISANSRGLKRWAKPFSHKDRITTHTRASTHAWGRMLSRFKTRAKFAHIPLKLLNDQAQLESKRQTLVKLRQGENRSRALFLRFWAS